MIVNICRCKVFIKVLNHILCYMQYFLGLLKLRVCTQQLATMAVSQYLLLFLLVIPCCSGGLVVYVQSNSNKTTCPPGTDPTINCRLLSEYATDPFLSLDLSTTFVFLPGEHVLSTPLFIGNVRNVSEFAIKPQESEQNTSITCIQRGNITLIGLRNGDLTIKPQESERTTSIRCVQHGNITLIGLRNVELLSLEFSSCNVSMIFIENTAIKHCRITNVNAGPALVVMSNEVISIEHCTFTANTDRVLVVVNSALIFKGNEITGNSGPWTITFDSVNATFTGSSFTNNTAQMRSALIARSSYLAFSDTNIFNANYGLFGVISASSSTLLLDGSTNFTDNSGFAGGVIVGIHLNVFLGGHAHFENNSGDTGGVVCLLSSQCTFTGEHITFLNNRARYGGAVCVVESTLTFKNTGNNVTFTGNTALLGGALFFSGVSSLKFLTNSPGTAMFERNTASIRGGAIFIQDTDANTYCTAAMEQNLVTQECSLQVMDYDRSVTYQTRMFFIDNYATEAGSAIFGGAIDSCILENAVSGQRFDGQKLFNQIAAIADNTDSTDSSVISSEPYIVCACDGGEPNCALNSITKTIYPGGSVEIEVVAIGQRNGTVPAIIVAIVDSPGLNIRPLETNQRIPGKCSTVSYTVFTEPGNVSMELFTEGACLTRGIGLTINFEVLECPPGFALTTTGAEVACTCAPRLKEYTDTCNSSDGTILRNGKFWVGYDQELEGLILYFSCPFDYCITDEINFNVEDNDAQCNYNREGILCGQCSDSLSIVLGSSRCEGCSDSYLALLLLFALAGVILVAFLLLLNLTVAAGTINGLIFYANIVDANEALIFPSNSNIDILRVFIAWINLDFGIESCFYDGMDTYALTWLQYAFPLYFWVLIGLVFVISHFSTRASRYLGSNPVAVLATLILLSYTKVLRTVIEAFSAASLDYPQGVTQTVWMKDGNVPFLDVSDGRHLGLFIASLLVLVFLFIPYTLLLLASQWLQSKSNWKIFSWVNKPRVTSFLDAYHAPYRPQHRY